MTEPLTITQSFESIEQLDAMPGELGWPLQYRQLEPGSFSSTFSTIDSDSWFLLEEQSSRSVEVQAGATEGMVVLASLEGNPVAVNGQSFTASHVFVQTPGSDLRATLPAGVCATQIGVSTDLFEAVVRAVAPELSVRRASMALYGADGHKLARARTAMKCALFSPAMRPALRDEVVSQVLAELVRLAATRSAPANCDLHRAPARRALDRARDYIEAHLGDTIRVDRMCSHAHTTLRSLERIFAREMGMTPQKYIKIRRLNAVRRQLLSSEQVRRSCVTEIAQDYGFSHLGRFSGDYHRHFGEYPRDTLAESHPG